MEPPKRRGHSSVDGVTHTKLQKIRHAQAVAEGQVKGRRKGIDSKTLRETGRRNNRIDRPKPSMPKTPWD